MTNQKKKSILAFFSSVKLALSLLFLLAATSIIGTLIPQGKSDAFYVQNFGQSLASLMQTLHIPDMYSAWWFLLLLALFSMNLIVCSIDRIPTVWRLVTKDNLDIQPDRLNKMKPRHQITRHGTIEEVSLQVKTFLHGKGWPTVDRTNGGNILLFSQKGGWTRFGVYAVHLSILIILLGAVIGSSKIAANLLHAPTFAFKGSIMLPESQQTDHIYSFADGSNLPLDFAVRCDRFDITYYDNGMPKEYLSKLTVLEDGKEIRTVDIVVNKPLTHRGVTFYQSSYQPLQELMVTIGDAKGTQMERIIVPGKQFDWEGTKIRYGIINAEARGEAVTRYKVWFTDGEGEPSTFWIENNRDAVVERPSGKYHFQARQLYATGLQVAKDPGVWLVYLGCITMLLGLFVAFFLSHRKIYVLISQEGEAIRVLFSGSAHKNKVGFEKYFQKLTQSYR